ncbi:hypothetical protein [Candidatus Tisiphia endosymbiont of Beris chalybata]|uniref:hypothetical protein n=1 Tax=Candidatus Tisiphia endosymbiont of Beris chalybata TaxID=3066262 RepID=UPI00312C8BCF
MHNLKIIEEFLGETKSSTAAYSLGYYDTYTIVRRKHSSHAYLKINTLYVP